MVSYKVVAPYVTLKVKDVTGTPVIQGFYAGALVDALDVEQAKAQADMGFLEPFDAPAPEPELPPADEAPKGNASREEWAAYAKDKKGAPEEDTRPVDEGGLKQTELRDKYGN